MKSSCLLLVLTLSLCGCTSTDPSSKAEEWVREKGKTLGDVLAFKKVDGEKTVVNAQERYKLQYRLAVKTTQEFYFELETATGPGVLYAMPRGISLGFGVNVTRTIPLPSGTVAYFQAVQSFRKTDNGWTAEKQDDGLLSFQQISTCVDKKTLTDCRFESMFK